MSSEVSCRKSSWFLFQEFFNQRIHIYFAVQQAAAIAHHFRRNRKALHFGGSQGIFKRFFLCYRCHSHRPLSSLKKQGARTIPSLPPIWRSSRDLNPGGAVNTLRDFESRLFDHLSTAPTFVSGQAARFVRPACRHVIYYTSFGAPRQSKIRPRQGRGRKTQRSFKRRNGAAPGLSRSPLRRRCPASRTRSRRCPYRRTGCRPRSPAAASPPGSGKQSGRCSSR